MGAETTWNIYTGTSARDAYNRATDQAAWEFGSGGYTGTIAESQGFEVAMPRTRYDAEKAADALMHGKTVDGLRVSKWEYSVMIPLIPDTETRTVVLPLDVSGIGGGERDWTEPDPWEVAAEKAVRAKLKPGEHIVSLKYYRARNADYPYFDGARSEAVKKAEALAKRSVGGDVRRTTGERKTLWAVLTGDKVNGRSSVLLVTEDLEQAKKAAKERALSNTVSGLSSPVGIVQWTVRDDGTGFLYEASASVAKEVVGVVAVIGKKVGGAAPQEWLTVGCYSS